MQAIQGYGIAAIAVILAWTVRHILDPLLAGNAPYLPFVLAIIVTARMSGPGPGYFATALSALVVDWAYIEPLSAFAIPDLHSGTGLALFVLIGGAVAWLVGNLQAAFSAARRAESALREKARLVDLSHDAIITMDPHRRIIGWNRGAEEMYGYTESEALGKVIHEFLRTSAVRTTAREIDDVLYRESRWEGELDHVTRDGRTLHAESRHVLMRDKAGGPSGILEINRDVTDRKRSEEALRQSHARLERVLDVDTVGVMFWDLSTGLMIDSNKTFLKLTGYSRSEVEAGKLTWQRLTPPEYRETSLAEVEKFRATGRVGPYEKEYFRKDGTRLWLLFAGSSLGGNECVEFCVDISDRKKAEEALRESESLLRTVLNSIGDPVYLKDSHSRVLMSNPAFLDTFGRTEQEAPGRDDSEVLPDPAGAATVLENDRRIMDGNVTAVVEETVETPRGRRVFLSTKSPWRDRDGNAIGLVGVSRDITERKLADDALRRALEHSDLAMEAASLGSWDYDVGTGAVRWDDRTLNMFAVPAGQTMRWADALNTIHPEDRTRVEGAVNSAVAGKDNGAYHSEFRVVWPDGSIHWIAGHGRVFFEGEGESRRAVRFVGTNQDVTERMRAVSEMERMNRLMKLSQRAGRSGAWHWDLETGALSWTEELSLLFGLEKGAEIDYQRWVSLIDKDDQERVRNALERFIRDRYPEFALEFRRTTRAQIRWLEMRGQVVSRDGRPAMLMGITTDITERKRLEEALLASNEDLRRFAYIASHDLQEPLRNITTFCQLLERSNRGKLDGQSEEFLDIIVNASDRMKTLITDLLNYSRVANDDSEGAMVDLNRTLETAIQNLRAAITESNAEITAGPMPTLVCVEPLLIRVFENLIGNAIKYRSPERSPAIEISAAMRDGNWQFRVSDNGIGFDMKYADTIFVMFRRLHGASKYSGSGIGLAIVKRVVERHGGQVCATSEIGKGSEFMFTLPVSGTEVPR